MRFYSTFFRYAVVAFGGAPPFEDAHSIVYNNDIFADSHQIRHHFDHIQTSNTNTGDISRAIKVASELVFRPGASKTFILMPCSNCNVSGMHVSFCCLHFILTLNKYSIFFLLSVRLLVSVAIFVGTQHQFAHIHEWQFRNEKTTQ